MAMLNRASNLITTALELLDTLSTTPVESISNLRFAMELEVVASGALVNFLHIVDDQSAPDGASCAHLHALDMSRKPPPCRV
jgi:hypothetical protein